MRLRQAALWMTALLAALALLGGRALAEDDQLAKIKARGTLIAGVKYDTPPFGYLDEKNQPVGFDIDIVRKIAEHLGVGIELVQVTSQTRIPMLVSGNVDLVAASMTHTREREKAIDFSITYYTGGQSLLVPASSGIHGLADLAGKQVSVQQSTTLEKTIAAMAPAAKVVAFKDYDSAWLALAQGRVDALTGSLSILQGFAKGNANFKVVGELFSVEPFGVGLRHGDWALRNEVNATLQDLWRSGDYAALFRNRFGADPTIAIESWP